MSVKTDNPFGLVQSLMKSHCGGRVPRHKGGSAPLRFPDLSLARFPFS
ncbi:MAG: hypothetical protein V7K21_24120 [Nostoc sp.]